MLLKGQNHDGLDCTGKSSLLTNWWSQVLWCYKDGVVPNTAVWWGRLQHPRDVVKHLMHCSPAVRASIRRWLWSRGYESLMWVPGRGWYCPRSAFHTLRLSFTTTLMSSNFFLFPRWKYRGWKIKNLTQCSTDTRITLATANLSIPRHGDAACLRSQHFRSLFETILDFIALHQT